MTTFFLTLLVALDFGILYVIFFLNKRWQAHDDILSDVTEERHLISQIQDKLKNDIDHSRSENMDLYKKINRIAAQIEQEIANSGAIFSEHLNKVINEMTLKIEEPFKELTLKQKSLESLYEKVELKKNHLMAMMDRSEKICRFLEKKLPFDELLKELENKKYSDIQKLLAEGLSIEQIAQELDISLGEVKLIDQLNF